MRRVVTVILALAMMMLGSCSSSEPLALDLANPMGSPPAAFSITGPAADVTLSIPGWTNGAAGQSITWELYDENGSGLLTGFDVRGDDVDAKSSAHEMALGGDPHPPVTLGPDHAPAVGARCQNPRQQKHGGDGARAPPSFCGPGPVLDRGQGHSRSPCCTFIITLVQLLPPMSVPQRC